MLFSAPKKKKKKEWAKKLWWECSDRGTNSSRNSIYLSRTSTKANVKFNQSTTEANMKSPASVIIKSKSTELRNDWSVAFLHSSLITSKASLYIFCLIHQLTSKASCYYHSTFRTRFLTKNISHILNFERSTFFWGGMFTLHIRLKWKGRYMVAFQWKQLLKYQSQQLEEVRTTNDFFQTPRNRQSRGNLSLKDKEKRKKKKNLLFLLH